MSKPTVAYRILNYNLDLKQEITRIGYLLLYNTLVPILSIIIRYKNRLRLWKIYENKCFSKNGNLRL